MDNLVKVEGEMIVKDGTGRMSEPYEEEFIISHEIKTPEQARSLIRNGLIVDCLRKKVNGFRAVRTCQIVSMEPTKEQAPQSDLDKAFIKAIELGCIPENISVYKSPVSKLKAIEKAIELAETQKKKKKAAAKAKLQLEAEDGGEID